MQILTRQIISFFGFIPQSGITRSYREDEYDLEDAPIYGNVDNVALGKFYFSKN